MRRWLAIGLGAGLLGATLGQVLAQSGQLSPQPTNTVNGQSYSVFSMSLKGGNGLSATGAVAYPQSFPAAPSNNKIPTSITVTTASLTLQSSGIGLISPNSLLVGNTPNPISVSAPPARTAAPSVQNYSCATYRPDFSYQSDRLSFQASSSTDLPQIDMNFWPGLPPGTSRYVPLGEF